MSLRLLVVLAWLGVGAWLVPPALRVEDRLEVSARLIGSESAEVDAILAERFESPFAHSALLVARGVPNPQLPAGREVLREIVRGLEGQPGITRTLSYLDSADDFFAGAARPGTFLVVGLAGARGDQLLPPLRSRTEHLVEQLRLRYPAAQLRWTGEVALNVDLWRASCDEARAAERRALPITLLLLLLAFGSLAAALLPLLQGVAAVTLALGAVALCSSHWPLSILVVNVVSMLGLALGIDYALLTVTRFREARALGATPGAAAAGAARHAGGTVALSGAAVAIGFLALLQVPLVELRSAALGGLLVVVVAVLLAATLLPVLLCWLAPWLEAGRVRSRRPDAVAARWRAWAGFVAAHPWGVLLVAGLPLLLLAAQALRLQPRVPGGAAWLPPQLEATQGLRDLEALGRGGVVDTLHVVLELPEDVSALGVEGWQATQRLRARLSRDPRVARVQSLQGLVGEGESEDARQRATLAPAAIKRAFVSGEGDAALLEVVPHDGLSGPALTGLVRELRAADAAAWSGLASARIEVAGLPAFNLDYEQAVAGRAVRILALVLGATFVTLFAAFRSLLVPLKAILLNLLAVAGAFGALVLVFQDGWGVRLLGLAGPLDGVFPIVPLLVFCTVFGLSMDYEVFLLARVAEARRGGASEFEALASGLCSTGGLITSAAAIMVAVFAAFALGSFVLVKMLGFALAVAVLLDASVIRVAIGPALLCLAGRYNWWPGR